MRLVVTVSLLALLLAVPAASQVPDDLLIVPGVRIGKWTLEMSIDDLVQMNGPAFIARLESQEFVSAFQRHVWTTFVPEHLEAVSRDGKKVVWLSVGGVKFKTDKGIGFQSRRSAVETAYGKPTAEIDFFRVLRRMIYDSIGLRLTILLGTSLGDPVVEVLVFGPGTAKSIWRF